jgi:hypothetical protein
MVKSQSGWLVALGVVVVVSCGGQSTLVREGGGTGGAGGATGGKGAAGGKGGTGGKGGKGGAGGIGGAQPNGGTGGYVDIGGSAGVGGAGFGGDGGGRGGLGGVGGTAGGGFGGDGAVAGFAGASDCITDPSAIIGESFNVPLEDASLEGTLPSVFHFDQGSGPTGLSLIVGSEGQAWRATLSPDGEELRLQSGTEIRDLSVSGASWSLSNRVTVKSLALCVHPGLDIPPTLDVTGQIHIVRNGDDYLNEWDQNVAVYGIQPDNVAPTLPATTLLDPLVFENIPASEPLRDGATATLADNVKTPLDFVAQSDTVVGFRPFDILPLGLDAAIVAQGADLAANVLRSMSAVTTKPDPGNQPFDGFESTLHVASYGRDAEPSLLTGSAALSGNRSLSVPPRAIAMLHLVRPSTSATHLRLDLQTTSDQVYYTGVFITVRAGVVGGSEIKTVTIPVPQTELIDQGQAGGGGLGGDSGGTNLNPVVQVDIALSELGNDVLLEIESVFIESSASVLAGAIVDNVRVE